VAHAIKSDVKWTFRLFSPHHYQIHVVRLRKFRDLVDRVTGKHKMLDG
jgi:hypothetical protein